MTKSIFLLKSICIQIAITLIALLALGPFLHAHYGTSTITGFHIAGVNSVGVSMDAPLVASFLQENQEESAAVGVVTSYARKVSLDVQDESLALLVFVILVASVVLVAVISSTWRLNEPTLPRTAFSPGYPPFAHAPPARND